MEFTSISLASFRRRLIMHLIWQGLTVGAALYYFNLGYQQGRSDLSLLALLGLLVLQPVGYVVARLGGFWLGRFIPERLKTLYPWLDMPQSKWFTYLFASPIVTLGLLIYLWNKDEVKTDKSSPWIVSHLRIVTFLIYLFSLLPISYQVNQWMAKVPVLGVSRVSYWVSGPVIFYLSSLIEEIQSLEKIQNRIKNGELTQDPIQDLTELGLHQNPSSTGLILMTAMSVSYDMKQRKLSENMPTTPERQFDSNLRLIEDLSTITSMGNQTQPQILKYNPLSFFTQSARIGIISTSLFAVMSDLKFQQTFLPRLEEMTTKVMENLEKSEVPEETKRSISFRTRTIRTQVQSTRQYQLWQSMITSDVYKKASSIFPFLRPSSPQNPLSN